MQEIATELAKKYSLPKEIVLHILEEYEKLAWQDISLAPKDGTEVLVMAEDLSADIDGALRPIFVKTSFHKDAGWTVCTIRKPTKFRRIKV